MSESTFRASGRSPHTPARSTSPSSCDRSHESGWSIHPARSAPVKLQTDSSSPFDSYPVPDVKHQLRPIAARFPPSEPTRRRAEADMDRPGESSYAPARFDQMLVQPLDLANGSIHRESIRYTPLPRLAHLTRTLRIGEQVAHRVRKRRAVFGRHQNSRDAMLDDFWISSHRGGNYRNSNRRCLQQRIRKSLAQRRKNHNCCFEQQIGNVRAKPCEDDATRQSKCARPALQFAAIRSIADDQKRNVGHLSSHPRCRLQEVFNSLHRI